MNSAEIIENKISSFLSLCRELEQYSDEELVIKGLQITPEVYKEKILNQNDSEFKRVCSAPLYYGSVFYRCHDCNFDDRHVYCLNCMDKKKHKNHVITYHYSGSSNGFCDCGNNRILNKESFCDRHCQTEIKQWTPKEHFGEEFIQTYEEFIMISFSLLFKLTDQIVDYPYKYLEFVESINSYIEDEEIDQDLTQLQKSEKAVDDYLKVKSCLFKILNHVLPNNIFLAILTSQCFYKPISESIQQHVPMKHSHSLVSLSQFQVLNFSEKCNCTILELFVKYSQFFSTFGENQENEYLQIFFQLQIEANFNQLLCKAIVQNSNHLYRPYYECLLVLNNGEAFITKINKQMLQYQSYEKNILQQFLKSGCLDGKQIKNGIFLSDIVEYFDFLSGEIITTLLQLFKETKNNRYYQIFDVNNQNLLFIPLCDKLSFQVANSFLIFLKNQLTVEIIGKLFDQILELVGKQSFAETFFTESKFSEIQMLQNQSLLIYALTRSFPCIQTEANVFSFQSETVEENENYYLLEKSLKLQILILKQFRTILRNLSNILCDKYQQYPFALSNTTKLILNYYFNNLSTTFKIDSQEQPEIIFFKNSVISDRNFISILSAYLKDFSDPQAAYESLLEINGNDMNKLNLVLLHLLKRTSLSLIVLGNFGNQSLYSTSTKWQNYNARSSAISLEQVDITFIQIYAFLFGAKGINDIVLIHQEISEQFKLLKNSTNLICRIASVDHEYFQTINFCQQNKISEDYRKSLSKLFQTVFYASSFLSYQQIIQVLQNISFENMMDFEQIILSSCTLNQDNGLIELKQSLKPALYEPILSNKVPELKELINNKLRDQNDYFTELFGSALQFELSQPSNTKPTLTQRRLIILKAISQDGQQQLLDRIVNELKNQIKGTNYKKVYQCLEENSVYINLLSTVNKYLNPQNERITQLLDSILLICQQILATQNHQLQGRRTFEAFIKLLGKQTITIDEQGKQNKDKIIQKKKQLLQQKFQQMSSKIQIIEQPHVQQDQESDQSNQQCSLCRLKFAAKEQIYRLVLIQKTNIHKYQEQMPEMNQFNDFFNFHISACNHLFHSSCLRYNGKKQQISDNQFFQCSLCLQPYNYLLNVSNDLKNIFEAQLQSLNYYLQTLNQNEIEYLYSKYSIQDELDASYIINGIFTQGLCNLIFQLLSDAKQFIEKEYHIILQTFVQVVQQLQQNGKVNSFKDAFSGAQSILPKFIGLVDQFLISNQEPKNFMDQIQDLLKTKETKLYQDIFFSRKIEIGIQYPPSSINQLKIQLSNILQEKLKPNFQKFLLEYLLSPCQKKRCSPIKLPEYNPLQTNYSQQVICLICFKKMCCYCHKNQKNNINSHSYKKHEGKTLFMFIQTGYVCVLTFSNYSFFKNSLFKSLIGEEPQISSQGSKYYEKFYLNPKIIDEILDIILGERYLNVQFQNLTKMGNLN